MKKVFLAALLTLLIVSIPSITHPKEGMALKPHDPIYIDENQNFTLENGVVSGSGTEDDPYIIEGWEIIGGDFGIRIEDTDVYFVIRNCAVREAESNGIVLKKVINGQIENCTVQEVLREDGIVLTNSHNCTVADNLVENSYAHGIALFTSDNNVLKGNTLKSNSLAKLYHGIKLFGSSHNLLLRNSARYNKIGIEVRDLNGHGIFSVENILLENIASDNEVDGIRLLHAINTTLDGNTVSNNLEVGIRHYELSGSSIDHNNLFGNALNASQSFASVNQWDNNVEGNYWSDYSGWDRNGDGISDISYRIEGGGLDRYPLMRPWKPGVVVMGVKFTGPDEFVTVRNWSEEDIDLTGWQLQSVDLGTKEVAHSFLFPVGCHLSADGKIRVHSGPEAAGRENDPCGSPEIDLYRGWNDLEDGGYVWDDLEGIVRLINDEGEVLDEYKYHWWMGG